MPAFVPSAAPAPAPAVTAAVPEVPAFLSTHAEPTPVTGALEVPRIFTEGEPRREREREELDVPDFLK